MNRGVYAVATGMRSLIELQGRLSHNLSNINTAGFKQEIPLLTPTGDRATVQIGGEMTNNSLGPLGYGVYQGEQTLDLAQGPLEANDSPLALAITGDAFFHVQTPDGVRFTRDGSFGKDAAGYLVTSQGYHVLGEGGPIQLPQGDYTINQDGTIWVGNGVVSRLALSTFVGPDALVRAGDGLFIGETPQPVIPGQAKVLQGYLERSNVDVTATLITMMTALRSYESSQKILKMQDEQTGRLFDLGRF